MKNDTHNLEKAKSFVLENHHNYPFEKPTKSFILKKQKSVFEN